MAQAIYAQCDVYGNKYVFFECFVEIQKYPTGLSLDKQDAIHNGKEYMQCTTKGWFVSCKWKDSSTSWEKLSNMKESHPLQIAEYAVAMGIDHEQGINWWILHMLKKHDTIIALEAFCQIIKTYP